MKSLPIGTSYAVWVGVGAMGTAILGIVLLGESAYAGRLVGIGLIVAGIVGLGLLRRDEVPTMQRGNRSSPRNGPGQ